ncbi:hypothetical protein [Haladaptatus sp.]
MTTLTLTAESLQAELSKQVVPVEVNGELVWSDEIQVSDLE